MRFPLRVRRAPLALAVCLISFVLVAPSLAWSSTPVDAGYRDFSYGTAGSATPTGEKPQSLLWWNDGFWWGVLWDPAAVAYAIHKFDVGSQSWASTGVVVDARTSSKGDVLWDGQRLYVVTYVFSNVASPVAAANAGRLYRFSYAPATDQYTLDPGFPVVVNGSRSETLVLDKDTTGKLWVTWVEGGKVKINRSLADDLTWGTPFDLPVQSTDVDPDEISSVVAMGGKIGVMWSDQLSQAFYFATHVDGQGDTNWQPRETAFFDSQLGQVADDHLHLAWAPDDGALYAAIKTGLSGTAPLVAVLKRTAAGAWSRGVYGTGPDNHTRPTIVVNPDDDLVYVYAMSDVTGRQVIYRKTAATGTLTFPPGLGTPVIDSPDDPTTNNPTTTKQAVNAASGILVAASDQNTRFYLHHHETIAGSPQDRAPTVQAPASVSGIQGSPITVNVSASDPDGQPITSLTADLTNLPSGNTAVFNVSVDQTTGVLNWTPDFDDAGTYQVTFRAQNALSGSATTTLNITSGTDRAPTVQAPASVSGIEGSPITVNVSASDPDGQPITSLTADLTKLPIGNHAVFTASVDQTTGVLTWKPDFEDAGTYQVTFRAQNALSGSATTTLEIANLDRAPKVSVKHNIKIQAGKRLILMVKARDPDGDAITSLTADLSRLPAGHTAVFAAGPGNTSGALVWTPPPTLKGNFRVIITARNALSGEKKIMIHVKKSHKKHDKHHDTDDDPAFEDDEPAFVEESLPAVAELSPVWPNPAREAVAFTLELPQDGRIEWGIWDAQGRLIQEQRAEFGAGRHTFRWDGMRRDGVRAVAGIYFVRVRAGDETFTRRFIRL
jgi:FlgD Ig-like domain